MLFASALGCQKTRSASTRRCCACGRCIHMRGRRTAGCSIRVMLNASAVVGVRELLRASTAPAIGVLRIGRRSRCTLVIHRENLLIHRFPKACPCGSVAGFFQHRTVLEPHDSHAEHGLRRVSRCSRTQSPTPARAVKRATVVTAVRDPCNATLPTVRCSRPTSLPRTAAAQSKPVRRLRISVSASAMMRSISSRQLGMSLIRPATMPHDQAPASNSPRCITAG